MPAFHLATFSVDVTPPEGHPLCGGWIEAVRGFDDPLKALGVVLLGMGKPVVLCVLDWVALRNDAFRILRKAIAEAAHTSEEFVAVHCVHPHNAPFADVEAEKLIQAVKAPTSLDLKFYDRVVKSIADAVRVSLTKTQPFTHIGVGSAKVMEVASNRRILDAQGKWKFSRTSATKNPEMRAEPEGLIDPILRTFSIWNGDTPLAALHYYATHPMSYYGDGRVSADFCGLARQKFQDEDPKIFQMYFTGCAGNVTAGKYNDGSRENRIALRDRMFAAMKESFRTSRRQPVKGWEWKVEPVQFLPRSEASFGEVESRKVLDDSKQSAARRNNAAFQLAFLKRKDTPIEITSLDFGTVAIVHLPGEPFIEYQLAAQQLRKEGTVLVAGYGDDGTGYIPTAKAYLEGGYEPTVALTSSASEKLLLDALAKLLKK